jgi:hypothetical protein
MADEPYPPPDGIEPDETGDEIVETPRPWWYRVGLVALVVAVVLFLTPAITHLFFPSVNPRQATPPGHFASSCWACHDLSADVPIRSFD